MKPLEIYKKYGSISVVGAKLGVTRQRASQLLLQEPEYQGLKELFAQQRKQTVYDISCAYCGAKKQTTRNTQKYCSMKCLMAHKKEIRATRAATPRVCSWCKTLKKPEEYYQYTQKVVTVCRKCRNQYHWKWVLKRRKELLTSAK